MINQAIKEKVSYTKQRYIPTGMVLTYQDESLHIYRNLDSQKYKQLVYKAGAKNPLEYVAYRTLEERDARQASLIANYKHRQERKAERKAARLQPHTLQVGDILYSSWGYEQTNIDWYQVIARTDRTVTIQEIGSRVTETHSHDSGACMPVKDNFISNETMTKVVDAQYNGVKLSSYANAWKWDGKPKNWSSWA